MLDCRRVVEVLREMIETLLQHSAAENYFILFIISVKLEGHSEKTDFQLFLDKLAHKLQLHHNDIKLTYLLGLELSANSTRSHFDRAIIYLRDYFFMQLRLLWIAVSDVCLCGSR